MPLQQQHAAQLQASGISPEVIEERGYRTSESASDLARLGFGKGQCNHPALIVPLRDARGEIVSYQIRPDSPRLVDGRPLRYESPRGASAVVDVPPRCAPMLRDPQIPLLITEGAKKADAAASAGLCCVSVTGVWSWRGSNDLAGRTALPDWESVALNGGRHVYLVFDSDVTTKRDVHAALVRLRDFLAGRGAVVRIIYLPPGAHGEKCGLDDYLAAGHTPQELLALASDELRAPPAGDEDDFEGELPYRIEHGMIYWRQTGQDGGQRWRPIARFQARVTRNILEDDGTGQPQALFEVEAGYNGRQITTTMSPEEFDALHWPAKLLGAGASVYPGQSIREHVRFAIRRLSGDPEWHQVYTHTGWRRLDGHGWVYLHTGGGIGTEGGVDDVEVKPPLGMERYQLPDAGDVDAQREAVRRSLGMLEVADERATLPLLAAVYTAPLGELLQTDWVMWLYGESGVRKSTIAALALSHYGQFTRSRLPANFTSTVNAIETLLHAAKDAVIVIDDYAPPADRRAKDAMEGLVHRLLRAVGDNRGRQRLTADAKLKGEKPARGLPLVTAELRPAGVQSAEARTFEVQLTREHVYLDRLTAAQEEDAPYYARAMAGYLAWLAPQLDALRETLPGWVRAKGRELAARSGISHGRVAETGAKLLAGFGAFVGYATATGAVTSAEAEALMDRAARAVLASAKRTCGHQAEKRATTIFIRTLKTIFAARTGYLRDRSTGGDPPVDEAPRWGYEIRRTEYEGTATYELLRQAHADELGWVDEEFVYLIPLAAHRAVSRYAMSAGGLFPASHSDLGEALAREKLIVRPDPGRSTARIRIVNVQQRVWRLARAVWDADEDGLDPPPEWGGDTESPPGDSGERPTGPQRDRGCGLATRLLPVGLEGCETARTANATDTDNKGGERREEPEPSLSTPLIDDDDSISGQSGLMVVSPYSPKGSSETAMVDFPRSRGHADGESGESDGSDEPGRMAIRVGESLPEVPAGIINRADKVPEVMEALSRAPAVALDLETTGLNPRKDRARLISLATGTAAWVVDLATVDPQAVLAALRSAVRGPLVMHNGKFDLGFLMQMGFEPGEVADTMLLSQLLHAGQPAPKGTHALAGVAKRWLGVELPKDLQKSRWDGELTQAQLEYAARDAVVLIPLYERMMAAAAEAGIETAAEIEHRALPAITWMSLAGVPLDREAWGALAVAAAERMAALEEEMHAIAPKPPGLDLGVPWQWGNPQIVKRVFAEMGIDLASTGDEVLAALEHPLAELVRKHRKEGKLLSTYGESWPESYESGRIYPDWQQLGAEATGRMSCRGPNVQQMPRQDGYRQCVCAPEGRLLVTADYSQIELRIAAKIAGERRMLQAYQSGEDLHTLTASVLLGKTPSEVTKADRQVAKSCNFGMLYGMGAPGYQAYAWTNYGVRLTPEQAQHYRALFLMQLYPGLSAWHSRVRQEHAAEVRTLSGRRRVLSQAEPDTRRLNTPVQGTGADGLKRALALLWERREECPGAVPIIACHDEVVVECDAGRAEEARDWVWCAMMDGMKDLVAPVPVEVEPCVGPRWEK